VADDLPTVSPPSAVFRVGRALDPFEPPEWGLADPEDGTFGNPFDDPGALRGIPQEERFRTVYCATRSVAAFGETIARFRPSLKLLAQLERIDDAEPWVSV
jgi:hypothetical protein